MKLQPSSSMGTRNSTLLTHFVKRLKYCGYSNEFRYNILSKSMKRYDLRMRNVEDGKSYYDLEKGNNKDDDKKDWYKEGDTYESVLFLLKLHQTRTIGRKWKP